MNINRSIDQKTTVWNNIWSCILHCVLLCRLGCLSLYVQLITCAVNYLIMRCRVEAPRHSRWKAFFVVLQFWNTKLITLQLFQQFLRKVIMRMTFLWRIPTWFEFEICLMFVMIAIDNGQFRNIVFADARGEHRNVRKINESLI